jgi:hypothetical protein
LVILWHGLQPVGVGCGKNDLAPTKTHRLKRVPLKISNFNQGGAQAELSGADGAV